MIKIISNFVFLFSTLLLATVDGSVPDHAMDVFPIQWCGTSEIRASDYTRALAVVRSDTTDVDTAFRFFKLGLIYYKIDNYTNALLYLKLAAQKSTTIAPVAYSIMGDIARKSNDPKNACAAYLAALVPDCPDEYRIYIYERIKSIPDIDSVDLQNNNQFTEYQQWFEKTQVKQTAATISKIDSLLAFSLWSALDTFMNTLNASDNSLCKQISAISQNDSALKNLQPNSLLACANIASKCKNYTTAKTFLNKIDKDKNSTRSINAKALFLRAQIAYDSRQYDEAIRHFKKYHLRYGNNPDVVMSIARSYRSKGNPTESSAWYTKHVQLFPTHSNTEEIIWLQAWQMEDRKKFSNAGKLFEKIYTRFRSGKRRDESYIRHALCYYRQEKFDSTLIILNTFLKKYPTSNYVSAALFWKAKSYVTKEDNFNATNMFYQVINNDLFDFYSFRSQYLLKILGDTTEIKIDSTTNFKYAHYWIDSITTTKNRKVLSSNDSINYKRGIICASLGLIDIADTFLNEVAKNSTSDLALQYELALLYTICDASAQAYRIAVRLTWRIPQQHRKTAPLAIYMILYPAFFSKVINNEALSRDVDPNLISAVIRQESIFDPVIVSPAGAIGLMQIMPYTGVELAKDLKMLYNNDSLYNPYYNIRLGTYYIQDLLRKFDGNVVLALSSYNAGPHNAIRWYESNKEEEFDLFIEDIGYTETRGYVKKVLRNYWTYQKLSQYSGFIDNYYLRRLKLDK